MAETKHNRSRKLAWLASGVALFAFGADLHAQDIFGTTSRTGVDRIRLAAADFKPLSADSTGLQHTFDAVLYADLSSAGIFDIVPKSMLPQGTPGFPAEINLQQ